MSIEQPSRLRPIIARRRDEMVADLARWVAIPTGWNHTPGLDEFRGVLISRLEALGATTTLQPGDAKPDWLTDSLQSGPIPPAAVCRREEPGRPRILIAGHIDTVFDPHGGFQHLEVSPDGSTAIGPGVVDMKGGLLIAVVALESLAEAGIDLPWTFFLNSDEETGTYHSARVLREESTRHEFGLALEPALPDGALAVSRKGSGQFLVEAQGRSSHAGRDFFSGVSAVYALARVLTRIETMSDESRGITVNIGPLKGGAATNVVPDSAAAWGNARYPDPETERLLSAALDGLATQGDRLPRITVRRSFNRPAKPLTQKTERLAMLAREVAEGIGQALPFATTGGVCDGNIMQDAGLPTIDTLGVRGGGLHTPQEWIELASLEERALLLALLIERLSREPEAGVGPARRAAS